MEEEPDIQEPTSVEEQLNTEKAKPTKLNKNGQPRKQLSPEALERLAKAREKANAMRREGQLKKLEKKVEERREALIEEKIIKKELKEEPEEKELKEEHEEVEIIKEKKVKPKEKGKKKTKIIVEQSSDDSDEFEPNTNVVFVKRVSRKKKEVPIVPEPKVEMELPPPEPPRPPRPELTPQQRVLKSQYESMFSGGFMNQNNLMRRHY